MDLGIAGHVAIVTGGSRGLGAGMCRALAAEGARVVVWDQDDESGAELAEKIRGDGLQANHVVADVRDERAVRSAVASVIDQHGSIEILINCAGLSRDAALTDMTDDDWHTVIDVCLTGVFRVTRAVVPHMMRRQYGRIVNISSRAHLGDVNKTNYAAAKAGVVGLTSALALELAGSNITANAIAPGYMETDRVRALPYYAQIRERAMALTPVSRPGEVSDVSDAVLYLSSAQSGFITGEVLTIAGGRLR